jgi:uncharacterized protein YqeY
MSLEEQLRSQLTAAIKAKDLKTANLIRMINTKIMERRTAADFKGQVDDALILDVIAAYRKAMEKAKAEFAAVGERGKEQVAELQFEVDWCSRFLPKALSEDELRGHVAAAIATLPQKDPKMAGRVVGMIKKQLGEQADAAVVKKLAEELLSS